MKLKFDVTGMTCAACSARVEKVTAAVEGVDRVEVNLLAGSMTVEASGDVTAAIETAVRNAGYCASPAGEKKKEEQPKDDALVQMKKRIIGSAVFLGVLCVRYRGKWIDRFLSAMAGVLTAIPSYASGLLLLVVFSVWLGITPIYGVKTMSGYILPTIALTLATVGYPLKMVRNTMLDVLQQDFIRTARAIGENETRVVYGYAVRNALLPIVTTIGYQFVGLLSGTIIIENVFSINGVGTLMVNAVIARDIPLMLGIIVVLTVIFCAVQLLMELSYLVLDPRVRAKYGI